MVKCDVLLSVTPDDALTLGAPYEANGCECVLQMDGVQFTSTPCVGHVVSLTMENLGGFVGTVEYVRHEVDQLGCNPRCVLHLKDVSVR